MMPKVMDYTSRELNFQTVDRLKKIVFWGILCFLFLNVFPHVNALKDSFFYLSFIICLYLLHSKKIEFSVRSPLLVPLLSFTAWALLSAIFAQYVFDSFHSFYSHLIRYLFLYYLLVTMFDTRRHIVAISWTMVVASVLFFTGGLIYFYLVLQNPMLERFGFLAFSINIINFSTIFSILLSIQLLIMGQSMPKAAFLVFGIMILLVATLMTQSRGAVFSLSISTMILLSQYRKRTILFAAILILMVSISPLKHRIALDGIFTNSGRVGLIYHSMGIIKENPVIGVGFSIDTFKNENIMNQEKYESNVPDEYRVFGFILPHSMPLSLLVRTGIVGFLLFSFFLFSLYKMCFIMLISGKNEFVRKWGRCLLASLTMFIICGLFEPVFIHSLDTIFYTICALITILWKINERTDGSEYA